MAYKLIESAKPAQSALFATKLLATFLTVNPIWADGLAVRDQPSFPLVFICPSLSSDRIYPHSLAFLPPGGLRASPSFGGQFSCQPLLQKPSSSCTPSIASLVGSPRQR